MELDVREAVNAGIKQAAKEGAAFARAAGPYTDRSGKYRQSITYRTNASGHYMEAQIYAKQAGLTHLLENGHALWQSPGKRTGEFVHWKPALEYVDSILPIAILKKL